MYCAHLDMSWNAIVVASRVVFNRESWYPRTVGSLGTLAHREPWYPRS